MSPEVDNEDRGRNLRLHVGVPAKSKSHPRRGAERQEVPVGTIVLTRRARIQAHCGRVEPHGFRTEAVEVLLRPGLRDAGFAPHRRRWGPLLRWPVDRIDDHGVTTQASPFPAPTIRLPQLALPMSVACNRPLQARLPAGAVRVEPIIRRALWRRRDPDEPRARTEAPIAAVDRVPHGEANRRNGEAHRREGRVPLDHLGASRQGEQQAVSAPRGVVHVPFARGNPGAAVGPADAIPEIRHHAVALGRSGLRGVRRGEQHQQHAGDH